jgi:L-malate glycosyltransferase
MTYSSQSPKLSIFVPHPSDRLTNCKPDGDGLVAFGFIQHLAQRGHTLHVVVNSVEIEGTLPKNIKLYPANVETVAAPLRRFAYMARVRQIFSQIQQQAAIDVIHQLNPVVPGLSLSLGRQCPVVLGPIVAPWSVKVKLPLSVVIAHQSKQFIGGNLFRIQQKQASALLAATPAALVRLNHPEAMAEKIYDLRHGIDAHFFAPCSDRSNTAPPSILFLGQVSYHKGIFTLLDAFEQVVAQRPDCELMIAGPWSNQIDEVKTRIEKMAGRSQIKLLGPIQRTDVPHLISTCSVYCMPSYGEAFGMGALEAMACGKPVVGTDAGGLRYLIPDEGGRKVAPGNADALAQALLEIVSSPELQTHMGHHNRAVVEQTYAWERVTEQLESIYYKVLNSHKSTSAGRHDSR